MIAVLDSGAGNLQSALNAMKVIGADALPVSEPELLSRADKILFPGVGSWGAVMSLLKSRGFFEPLIAHVNAGKPYFGICMGLQVLFERSEEDPGEGLSILKGEVVKFRTPKVPQIGWNNTEKVKGNTLESGFYYFINSFHVKPREDITAVKATYMGEEFVAGVEKDNIVAVQFHPEKSAAAGLELLRRWSKS